MSQEQRVGPIEPGESGGRGVVVGVEREDPVPEKRVDGTRTVGLEDLAPDEALDHGLPHRWKTGREIVAFAAANPERAGVTWPRWPPAQGPRWSSRFSPF